MLTFESAQSLGVAGILEKLTVRHGQQANRLQADIADVSLGRTSPSRRSCTRLPRSTHNLPLTTASLFL